MESQYRRKLLIESQNMGLNKRTPVKFCFTNWRCSRTVLEHLELFLTGKYVRSRTLVLQLF